ncbi:amino acid adenylation domain-containing protein [Methyloraptor flagellatus]|uniref:Amino acid adenylation domain-containing protein n=1 Tax=Methyloraptor flagellatus TaxID=3162530 RepID=A0AAU7XHY3_9HYPH
MTAEPAVGPASDLAARVRAHVAAVLAMPADALDETAPLRSYGLDSIGGIKLQERLADDLGVALSGLDILESADLAALVAEIGARLGPETLAETRSPSLPVAAPDRPLSEGQKGLWAFQAAHPGNAAYNLPFLLAFEHRLDDARLEAAIRAATARHPVLGERIVEQVDGPRRVGGAVAMVMRETAHDLDKAALSARLEALATVPFRLADEAPLRVHRIDRNGATLLLVVVHHIAFDGASVAPFFETLLGAYAGASIAGPEGSDFDAFVAAEAETIAGEAADRARRHFASRLAGAAPALDLLFDPPQETGRHDADAAVVQRIEAEEAGRIAGFCRTAGVTPASLFLGAFGAVLGRWAGTDDVVVGVTASVRRRREFADLVGYCVNMVPVRLAFAEENTWAETLRAAQRALTGDLDHAAYPFARLVRDLRPERSDLRTPVFQVAFNHTPHVGDALRMIEAKHAGVRFLPDLHQRSEYALELEISEAAGAYELRLKFDSGLFRPATAERIVGHLRALIAEGIARPAEPLGALDMLTEAERRVILGPWAGVDSVEAGTTVDRLVLAQAARTPDALAVVQGDTRLTYTAVAVAARQVAQSLLSAGIQPGDRVGIALRRTPMLPVALLGVFMAGAAYVPLEPDLPEPRLRFMAEDAGLRMILTEPALRDRIAAVAPAGIAILEAESGATRPVGGEADPALATGDGRATPDGLAYVIYTSGSTGRPKGVMIRQSAYVSALLALARTPGLAAGDRLLAVTTFGFDIAGFELLGPLVVGATCSLCPADVVQDADRLRATIEAERPTLIQATPSLWDMLFESGWRPHAGLRLLCGGEPLPDGLRRRFEASAGEAWNMYGPTEATIWATAERIAADAPRGVGRPLANSRIYVLDRALRPVPIGVIGELCIGGQAIAEGYLGRPDLTAARFLANPFEPGGRLYRTGDRARWLPDGSVDLLGRADDQVKIRGYRIELGDVETHLAAHPAVREAIAVVETVEGHARLAAHVLLRRDARVAETDLRDHMKARVPHYMVPARFVVQTAFPLTPNGKVDRAALAAAAVVQAEAIIAPRGRQDDGLERRIAAIWREVLRRPEIGRDDGFFEVGGDSILAVIVARRIATAADRPFGVTDLFRHPSIAAIAAHLGRSAPPFRPRVPHPAPPPHPTRPRSRPAR